MEVKEILSWAVLLLLLAGGILATISAAYGPMPPEQPGQNTGGLC